jgi:hypothetical protein
MSVGIILTGEILFPAVRPAQEDTAPTHKAWVVERGSSKACLGEMRKWTKAKEMT